MRMMFSMISSISVSMVQLVHATMSDRKNSSRITGSPTTSSRRDQHMSLMVFSLPSMSLPSWNSRASVCPGTPTETTLQMLLRGLNTGWISG